MRKQCAGSRKESRAQRWRRTTPAPCPAPPGRWRRLRSITAAPAATAPVHQPRPPQIDAAPPAGAKPGPPGRNESLAERRASRLGKRCRSTQRTRPPARRRPAAQQATDHAAKRTAASWTAAGGAAEAVAATWIGITADRAANRSRKVGGRRAGQAPACWLKVAVVEPDLPNPR